jgi:hypothetical protein
MIGKGQKTLTRETLPVSPTLLNFAGTRASRNPDWFGPEVAKLGTSQRSNAALFRRW